MGLFRWAPVQDLLEQDVVLPGAGDEQVLRRRPDQGEAASAEHYLGRLVVRQRAGLDSVQAKACGSLECELNGGGGDPSTGVPVVDPVAERGVLGDATGEVGQVDPADDLLALPDQPRVLLPTLGGRDLRFGVLALPGLCEEPRGASRLPRREVLTVDGVCRRQDGRIVDRQGADLVSGGSTAAA